ncbi:MAG TPA: tetratricopeptide repeat protein [Candidatus Eisenbacteria bacterium]|nr:tetratricopeptide repeat protein [Candidatus Eisenbacteria bacterium]
MTPPPAVADSLPDFDARWDYDHPDSTEAVFRALLPQARASGNKDYLAQLLTQIARTQGLQMKFDDATKTLEEAQTLLTPDMRIARVRVLLERGRVWNSSKHQDFAIPLFTAAWDLAREASALGLAGADGYAVDAAHMLAIAQPGDLSIQWNETAIAYAEQSKEPKARQWLGSLYNNQGWGYFGKGDYPRALEIFQKALAARRAEGDPAKIRIAEWCVARTLRSLQRNDDALAIQKRLLSEAQAAGQPDGYIFEEMGECLIALQRPAEARPYFAVAYEMLSKDPWLTRDEPERLERIRKFAGL